MMRISKSGKKKDSPKHGQRGFTLMETLLAVTLFIIVITSSCGVFLMGVRIWKRTTSDSRYERKIYLAIEKMQTEIQQSLPVPKAEPLLLKEAQEMKFQGDEKSFLFPAVLPLENDKGEITYQSGALGYAWNSSRQVLCRQMLTAGDFFLRKIPVCKDVLFEVKRANFEYLVGNPLTKDYSWYKDWDGKEGIPRALRIYFEISQKDKKKDPGITFSKTFWIPVSDRVPEELKLETPAAAAS